jgi:hypothetical protein
MGATAAARLRPRCWQSWLMHCATCCASVDLPLPGLPAGQAYIEFAGQVAVVPGHVVQAVVSATACVSIAAAAASV